MSLAPSTTAKASTATAPPVLAKAPTWAMTILPPECPTVTALPALAKVPPARP